jgi:hypothetical protein
MSKTSTILSVEPLLAIPGGEISVYCEAPEDMPESIKCLFGDVEGRIISASGRKLMVEVPEGLETESVSIRLSIDGSVSNALSIEVGSRLCNGMHIVSNPAVDPKDGSIVITKSGTRGQQLPETLFRYRSGDVAPLDAAVLNPTGLAFDSFGRLVVTNRADGEVVQINEDQDVVVIASDLGVASGIAFDAKGAMFIGDRSGTIFKLSAMGDAEEFAKVEASVSAFHMAFGKDGNLYVSAPGLCSYDVIHVVSPDGDAGTFFKGLGRPQGIAVSENGDVFVAACLAGRHGIVRISNDGAEAELWVAGMGIVGLCFDKDGGLIVATTDSIYRIDTDIHGLLPLV